jgi:hypothetical protein
MNNFGVTLVNYKEFAGHDGMPGFNVDIKYKGKKIAHAYDDAWGGPTDIHAIGLADTTERKVNEKLLKELLDDVGANYEYESEYSDKRPSAYTLLEFLVSDLVDELTRKKDDKKGILIKHGAGYLIHQWSVQIPTLIKRYRNGLEVIQKDYDKLKADGKEILNTEYLKSVGVEL